MPERKCILLTGGARSGKSRFAQELAMKLGKPVLFVATAEALDEDMKQRIERHRRDRPASWQTLESPKDVGRQISEKVGKAQVVIVDCITMLINNVFNCYPENTAPSVIEAAALREISGLIDCINSLPVDFIIVTNEVGLGIVPQTDSGRVYRDILGRANQVLANRADTVLLMVAGLPLKIKPVP